MVREDLYFYCIDIGAVLLADVDSGAIKKFEDRFEIAQSAELYRFSHVSQS